MLHSPALDATWPRFLPNLSIEGRDIRLHGGAGALRSGDDRSALFPIALVDCSRCGSPTCSTFRRWRPCLR